MLVTNRRHTILLAHKDANLTRLSVGMTIYTLNLAYNGNGRSRNFHVAGSFRFVRALDVWIFRTLDDFRKIQFSVMLWIHLRHIFIYIGMEHRRYYTDRRKRFTGRTT